MRLKSITGGSRKLLGLPAGFGRALSPKGEGIGFSVLYPKMRKLPAKQSEERIPTYAADGARLRNYTLSAIEHLLSRSVVVVHKNRAGVIVMAQFRSMGGAHPMRNSALCGTRYSFLERIHESRMWSHRVLVPRPSLEELEELGDKVNDEAARESFVRSIFNAVPLSCLVG